MQVNHNVSTVTLLNIFQLTLNCGWNQTEKNQIIVDTWQAIQHTIRDLFQEFLITGTIFNLKPVSFLRFLTFVSCFHHFVLYSYV